MAWVAEAALRSLVVAGLLRLGIALFRVTQVRQEKTIWITLLLGALAMPCLAHWTLLPPVTSLSFAAPIVVLDSLGDSRPLLQDRVAIFVLYAAVSSVLLLRMFIGTWRIGRIRKQAVLIREPWTQGLDVRVARELSKPATFGTTILLPTVYNSWSESKRTIVLQHEKTHVRHRDSHIQWLAGLHICLFWFSPLPWWLRRRLAQLAEYISDDEVLRLNTPRLDYATVLLEEAETHPNRPLVVSMASHSLEQRIDRVLAANPLESPPSHGRHALAALSVIPLLVLASVSLGQQRHAAAADPGPPVIASGPSQEELARYYPAEAARQGVDGLVRITVTLDEKGRATSTQILSETPAGMGFAQAAAELARQFKYANPTVQPGSLTYKIKFELRK
jgi:bla regulator protein blaR1